jgi:hypothetical protein
MPLFRDPRETVKLERWQPGTRIERAAPGGIEVLVLEGRFSEGGETFEPQSWLRLPCGATLRAQAEADGCRLWIKEGHLAHAQTVPGHPAP